MIQRRRVFLSLCSGYSGESEAFIGEPGWCVVRIENDPGLGEVPHTRILDVVDWMDWIDTIPQPVEIVWCSPPCTEFSTARAEKIEEPSLEILQACLDVIDYLKPKFWIIENVRGAVHHFKPILGNPKQTIGPFFFWGRFPHIAITVGYKGQQKFRINRDLIVDGPGGHWTFNGIKYNKWDTPNRACIPYEISKKLLEAIDQQTTLGMYPSSPG